jgi:hypothetical protein
VRQLIKLSFSANPPKISKLPVRQLIDGEKPQSQLQQGLQTKNAILPSPQAQVATICFGPSF